MFLILIHYYLFIIRKTKTRQADPNYEQKYRFRKIKSH